MYSASNVFIFITISGAKGFLAFTKKSR